MARGFLAHDKRLDRQVALKLLHPHLSSRPENRVRIEREARGLAKLRQDNVIEVYDYSEPESEECYIVTEFIEGETAEEIAGKLADRLVEEKVI